MRPIGGGIESDVLNPVIDDPCVLTRAKVWRLAHPVREKEVFRLQASPFDPRLQRLARRECDFKLQANSDRPDVLELEGRFLTDELSFVPRFPVWNDMHRFHGGSSFGLNGEPPCTGAWIRDSDE